MKHLSTIAIAAGVLVTLGLVLAYFWVRGPSLLPSDEPTLADEQAFEQIVAFWKHKYPDSTFEGYGMHFCDGPYHNRLHISVPVEIEHLYTRKYSPEFLRNRLSSPEPLQRGVADDLRLIGTKPLLFTHDGVRLSYGPNESDEKVICRSYVVDTGRRSVERAR